MTTPKKPASKQPAKRQPAKRRAQKGKGKVGHRKLNNLEVDKALYAAKGQISLAAQLLDVSRQTLYTYLDENPDLKAIKIDFNELLAQKALVGAHDKVDEGDGHMIRFLLQHMMPEIFGNKVSVKSDSTVTVTNDFDPENMSEDELIAYQALLEAKAAAANGSGDD